MYCFFFKKRRSWEVGEYLPLTRHTWDSEKRIGINIGKVKVARNSLNKIKNK